MNNLPIRYHRHPCNTVKPPAKVRAMLAIVSVLSLVSVASTDEIDVWIGTGNAGIYHLKLDTDQGAMTQPTLASDIKGAGFLAMHPNGRIIYSTDRANNGGVTALAIGDPADDQSRLSQINSLSTGDGGAACVGIEKTGNVVMSAQYGGGSVSTYLVNPDGSLNRRVETVEHGAGSGILEKRQATSHPHWVGTSPDNRFLMVPDLGMDRVVVYELNAETAELKPLAKIAVPPGSGPRHMKFHTSGKYAYVLNELTLTISVFEYNAADATFKEIQLIETLPNDKKDRHLNSAAEIRVHPSGRFVYSSNRGHDSISVFSVDLTTGKLTFVEREAIRGAWPRNFNIDPSGKWLIAAGRYSNTLALFEIDQESGELIFTRKVVNVPAPICVMFGSE